MMEERSEYWFVADVHLAQPATDELEREVRFATFLKSIPTDRVKALYMLGDIWDFWYEYRDVISRSGGRVLAALQQLMDQGVEVWFCTGNHDVWTYSYFESLGMHRFYEPYAVTLAGKEFCLGHGDMLGGAPWDYRLMMWAYNNRVLQWLFSSLHPWIAYRLARKWSLHSRKKHHSHHFRGEVEPLWKFAVEESERRHVDYFVFGHYHEAVDLTLPTGAKFHIVKDWISGGVHYAVFNGSSFELRSQASPAE